VDKDEKENETSIFYKSSKVERKWLLCAKIQWPSVC